MRKPKRMPPEKLAPYEWVPTGLAAVTRWGDGTNGLAHDLPNRLDFAQLFGNDGPVEVEIGFGKGLFLARSAKSHMERNYFGIEIIRKYHLIATSRLARLGLTNARACCADAVKVLRDHAVPESVDAVHVYFPDPWWKARHKKRTLFTPEFVALVLRVLKPQGEFHFATDVPDYAEMVRDILAATPELTPGRPPEELPPQHDMDYLTNFERRFRKEGKPIHRSVHLKRVVTG